MIPPIELESPVFLTKGAGEARVLTSGINNDTIRLQEMTSVDGLVQQMVRNPKGVRFVDLCRVCRHYFGNPRLKGSSHHIYKTPWTGDPRIDIQDEHGMAKAYQVRQVLKAIEKLEMYNDSEDSSKE